MHKKMLFVFSILLASHITVAEARQAQNARSERVGSVKAGGVKADLGNGGGIVGLISNSACPSGQAHSSGCKGPTGDSANGCCAVKAANGSYTLRE